MILFGFNSATFSRTLRIHEIILQQKNKNKQQQGKVCSLLTKHRWQAACSSCLLHRTKFCSFSLSDPNCSSFPRQVSSSCPAACWEVEDSRRVGLGCRDCCSNCPLAGLNSWARRRFSKRDSTRLVASVQVFPAPALAFASPYSRLHFRNDELIRPTFLSETNIETMK